MASNKVTQIQPGIACSLSEGITKFVFTLRRKEYVPKLIHATQSKALLVDARREEILKKVWISVLLEEVKKKGCSLFWFPPCKDTLLCPDMLPSALSSAAPAQPATLAEAGVTAAPFQPNLP